MTMTHPRQCEILGISGSLRKGSYNTELLRVAGEVAPPGASIELAEISKLPLYNADIEATDGFPPSVTELRDAIDGADGLLFATPEYNYSVTGALKNAIDWASRRPSPLDHKPAAILGTGGRSGTARAQRHLRDILQHNQLQVVTEPEVLLAGARTVFADGTLTDADARESIRRLVLSLIRTIEQRSAA